MRSRVIISKQRLEYSRDRCSLTSVKVLWDWFLPRSFIRQPSPERVAQGPKNIEDSGHNAKIITNVRLAVYDIKTPHRKVRVVGDEARHNLRN